MKKIAFLISGIIPLVVSSVAFASSQYEKTEMMPEISTRTSANFTKLIDITQCGAADWSGLVGIAKNITRSEAIQIAEDNPEITFFFYTKGYQMVLGSRVFHHGDAVFFKGEPCWGSAGGLSDGYEKKNIGS